MHNGTANKKRFIAKKWLFIKRHYTPKKENVAWWIDFLGDGTYEVDIMVEAKAKEEAVEAIKAYM